MPSRFFFACGTSSFDLSIARIVGQTDILAQCGSSLLSHIRGKSAYHVIVDSCAYPKDNPRRPSLQKYTQELVRWHGDPNNDHDWKNLFFAAGYDHIGSPGQTQQDYNTLMNTLQVEHIEGCPVVPVLHFPMPNEAELRNHTQMHKLGIAAAESILLDYELG